MKLKLGTTILNQRALKDLFWILFFIGIYVGVGFALREDGKSPISLPVAIPFLLIVAKLIRGIQQEVKNERNIGDEEKP